MAHIGIDARLTAYRTGGISTYIHQLVRALETLDTQNRCTVLHSRKADTSIATRFETASLFTPPHHRLERIALSAELTRFNLDMLHSPDFIPPLRGAKRHVITVHDLTFLHDTSHKDAEAIRYYNDQIEAAVKQADAILSVSEATRSDLMALLGVPGEKITIQPNGVHPRFKAYSKRKRSSLAAMFSNYEGLPGRYILFVGTWEPRKNIPALLDAYALLPQDVRKDYGLLLVGEPGWLFDATQERIEAMQAQGYAIHQRSGVSDTALVDLYNVASMVVLPSLYEGFGLPALEALACGVPVVASDTSALPEVVGDLGLLCDPHDPQSLADAMLAALDEREQARALRQGPPWAAQFTWERSAQIALSVYNSLT